MKYPLILIFGILFSAISTFYKHKMIRIYLKVTKEAPIGFLITLTYLSFINDNNLPKKLLKPFVSFWISFFIGLLLIALSLYLEVIK